MTPSERNKQENIAEKKNFKSELIFKDKNFKVMLIGIGVIALGFLLMVGGGSDDPNKFNEAIFSWRRIRLAPTLVLIGFGIEIYAILLNPDKKKSTKTEK